MARVFTAMSNHLLKCKHIMNLGITHDYVDIYISQSIFITFIMDTFSVSIHESHILTLKCDTVHESYGSCHRRNLLCVCFWLSTLDFDFFFSRNT